MRYEFAIQAHHDALFVLLLPLPVYMCVYVYLSIYYTGLLQRGPICIETLCIFKPLLFAVMQTIFYFIRSLLFNVLVLAIY